MRFLLILFIVMPILEMWVLIQVGGVIGALPTIGLVLLTACIGLALLRYQGSNALLSARQKLQSNEVPARELADGVFFAIGGALLLTPGFVTDTIGFACLTPGIRTWIIQGISRHIFASSAIRSGGFSSYGNSSHQHRKSQENDIIEGDFHRHDRPD